MSRENKGDQHEAADKKPAPTTWKAFIYRLLTDYCQTQGNIKFLFRSFYIAYLNELEAFAPNNLNRDAKVRQVFQQLRDDKLLTFENNQGTYTLNKKVPMPPDAPSPPSLVRENADAPPSAATSTNETFARELRLTAFDIAPFYKEPIADLRLPPNFEYALRRRRITLIGHALDQTARALRVYLSPSNMGIFRAALTAYVEAHPTASAKEVAVPLNLAAPQPELFEALDVNAPPRRQIRYVSFAERVRRDAARSLSAPLPSVTDASEETPLSPRTWADEWRVYAGTVPCPVSWSVSIVFDGDEEEVRDDDTVRAKADTLKMDEAQAPMTFFAARGLRSLGDLLTQNVALLSGLDSKTALYVADRFAVLAADYAANLFGTHAAVRFNTHADEWEQSSDAARSAWLRDRWRNAVLDDAEWEPGVAARLHASGLRRVGDALAAFADVDARGLPFPPALRWNLSAYVRVYELLHRHGLLIGFFAKEKERDSDANDEGDFPTAALARWRGWRETAEKRGDITSFALPTTFPEEKALTIKEWKTISYRYYLTDHEAEAARPDKPRTLDETAIRLGVSRERARQIEIGALQKISNLFKPSQQNLDFDAEELGLVTLASALETIVRDVGGALTVEEAIRQWGLYLPVPADRAFSVLGLIHLLVEASPNLFWLERRRVIACNVPPRAITCADFIQVGEIATHLMRSGRFYEVDAPFVYALRERLADLRAESGDKATLPDDKALRACVASSNGFTGGSSAPQFDLRVGSRELVLRALRDANTPLHFRAIAERVNAAGWLPEGRIINEDRVHNVVFEERETFVNTAPGTYGLAEWGLADVRVTQRGSSFENIADIAETFLKRSGKPMLRRDIVNYVLAQKRCRPTSVELALGRDPRFIRVDGLDGLAAWDHLTPDTVRTRRRRRKETDPEGSNRREDQPEPPFVETEASAEDLLNALFDDFGIEE